MNLERRLRGILGAAVLWGAGFSGISALIVVAVLFGEAGPTRPGELFRTIISAMTAWAIIGAVAGTLFGITVVLAERSCTLGALSSRRFALWGFSAGVVLPVGVAVASRIANHVSIHVDGTALVVSLISGALGAGIATLSLRLARKRSATIGIHHGESEAQAI